MKRREFAQHLPISRGRDLCKSKNCGNGLRKINYRVPITTYRSKLSERLRHQFEGEKISIFWTERMKENEYIYFQLRDALTTAFLLTSRNVTVHVQIAKYLRTKTAFISFIKIVR